MSVITIGGNPYNSYVTVANATIYLGARIGAEAWTAASADDKGRALVTATRMIQRYLAGRLDASQVPDPAVDPAPGLVQDATSELGYQLVLDSGIQDQVTTGSNTRRLQAGPASIEFFRPTDHSAGVLPHAALQLLLQYLAGLGVGAGVTPPYVSGVLPENAISDFLEKDEFGTEGGLP